MDGLPGAIAFLLLNDVFGDGGATIVFGGLPLEVHSVHVPVNNVWDTGFAWNSCVRRKKGCVMPC